MIQETIIKSLIRISQLTPLNGVGGYSCEELETKNVSQPRFPQAEREASQFNDFFSCFDMLDMPRWFQGKIVLDLGCGYGGKTVEYIRTCNAKEVHGIEPFDDMIVLSKQYADFRNINNCFFKVCTQDNIPYDSNMFDAVVSHDVLEHVSDPRKTLSEIHRVLKPNGKAFIVFPPYHGMMSHHLDYITRLPGLHLIFSPDALIRAINSMIASDGGHKYKISKQPMPAMSFNGKRKCLPCLNGMSSVEFKAMLSDFSVIYLSQKILMNRYKKTILGRSVLMMINLLRSAGDLPRDIFSSSLICILQKK